MNLLTYLKSSAILFKHTNPRYVIFFITSKCNFTCDFCLYYKQVEDKIRKKEQLTLEEIEKIAKNYGKMVKLELSGGEPFLHPELAEICRIFFKYSKPQIIDIPTNGSFPKRIYEQTKSV